MKHLNQALAANSAANAEDVVATKLFLRHQGHYAPPEWGISQFPDRALFDAIKAFQQSQGLKVDGVMNPEGETETAIKSQAQQLQSKGRNGDTILAHINPAEAQLLNDITDGGSINPDTGLPEFFFGDFFSGLSDSFSSIGTSMSDSFSSIGDSMSSFGDSFSSGLSDIGNSVSSNLDSTFGTGFSGQVGNFAGGLTSRVAGKYVSNKIGQKVGGPLGGLLGDTIGGAVGNTLGDTVSGAFKPSQPIGAGLTDTVKSTSAVQSSTPSLSTPTQARPAMSTPTPTKTPQNRGMSENGLGMRSHGLGMSSHGLGMGETPPPKTQPAPPKPEPMPSLKGLNIPQPAQPKPVNQAALKSVIADFKAKQQQGGIQNLLQNGPTADANAKPIGTADINTNQLGNLKPLGTAPALTPEASASNTRTAQALLKSTDYSGIKPHINDALKTGGAKAQAEVHDLTQQMNDLQPGSGTKLAQEVGLKPQTVAKTTAKTPAQPKVDFDKSLDTLRNGKPEDVQALAKEMGGLKGGSEKMPAELQRFSKGYQAHKASQNIPPAPKPSDFKKPKSFAIAQKKHAELVVRREADAVRAGVNSAANGYAVEGFQGEVSKSAADMYAGVKAVSGSPLSKDQISAMEGRIDGLVPQNYKSAPTLQLARGAGKVLGFAGTVNPLGGLSSGAGKAAINTIKSGGTAKAAMTNAYGGAAANVLGGKLVKAPLNLTKALTTPSKSNLLSGDIFKPTSASKALERALGYTAGEGLMGSMGRVDLNKQQKKPIR